MNRHLHNTMEPVIVTQGKSKLFCLLLSVLFDEKTLTLI